MNREFLRITDDVDNGRASMCDQLCTLIFLISSFIVSVLTTSANRFVMVIYRERKQLESGQKTPAHDPMKEHKSTQLVVCLESINLDYHENTQHYTRDMV